MTTTTTTTDIQTDCFTPCTCMRGNKSWYSHTPIPLLVGIKFGSWAQITIATVLVDFNLAVQYGIALHIYASMKYWCILIWQSHRQTAKPPNLIPHQFFGLYSIILVREDHNLFMITGKSPYRFLLKLKNCGIPSSNSIVSYIWGSLRLTLNYLFRINTVTIIICNIISLYSSSLPSY